MNTKHFSVEELLKYAEDFRFNPANDDTSKLPNASGFYIVCLKNSIVFPNNLGEKIDFYTFCKLRVIYIGIGCNLRKRDIKQHFSGHAGQSTLRKSLGVLMDFESTPRSKNSKPNKYKFIDSDEKELTDWMGKSLLMYYYEMSNPSDYEKAMIQQTSPPINIDYNTKGKNSQFVKALKALRKAKQPQNF